VSGGAIEVVCMGEPLVAFVADAPEPLHEARSFSAHVVGAELNVAVGLARLGVAVAFVGRCGDDPLGERIARTLRGEGISTTCLARDSAPTGTLVRNVRPFGVSEVQYARQGSAGSRLGPDDVQAARELIARARWLHVSGITAAMSPSGERAAKAALAIAREAGTLVSLDVNLRERLRPVSEQRPILRELAAGADLLLCGEDEGRRLTGAADVDALLEELLAWGPDRVVLKRGAEGAVSADRAGARVAVPARRLAQIVDPVGAGDAFAAGLLRELLAGAPIGEAMAVGCTVAAYVLTSRGDVEGLPSARDVELGAPDDPVTLR
jgi:2-dehydro-3-deoxygluconokinase